MPKHYSYGRLKKCLGEERENAGVRPIHRPAYQLPNATTVPAYLAGPGERMRDRRKLLVEMVLYGVTIFMASPMST